MTGSELLSLTKVKSDESYSMYLSNDEWNSIFSESLINVIQGIYNNRLNFQNSYDEITYLISISQIFNVNAATNTLFLGDFNITFISLFPSGTTVTATTSLPHDLQTGMRITFGSVTGTGTIGSLTNQTYTVTVTDSVTFTITTGVALTGIFATGTATFPDSITDYYHFLRAEVRFTKLTLFTVIASTNATPIMITLNKRSYLRDMDQVVIAGIGGNTNANGAFYLKEANEFSYFLYFDKYLQNPVSGNGIQTGIGSISEIFLSTIKFKRSDEKGSIYSKPTVQSPFYQQSKNLLRILPDDQPCDWIKMDYMRKPTYFIDVNDSTYDVTNNYSLPMQYLVVSEACILFAQAARDQLLLQESNVEKNINL